jgi:lipopolysaccharide biosynthesis glycosyltransferase
MIKTKSKELKMQKRVFYIVVSVLLILIGCVSLSLLKLEKTSIHQQHNNIETKCSSTVGNVDITLITDSQYRIPTMVSMFSAIKNKCPTTKYHFYIITENTTDADNTAITSLKHLAPDTVEITLISEDEPSLPYEHMERFLRYKVGMHKIYLPDSLHDLDKVIYMDGDTIVLKDLRQLFEQNVESVYTLAAKDGIYYRFPKEMAEIGLDKRGFYFNSGVMLYNLAEQRKDKVVDKLTEYINTHTDFFGDQDVLNVVFGDKVRLMSYRYNCISTFFEADDLNFLSAYFEETLPENTTDIYKNATVIHYAGDKPWEERYSPPYLKQLWFTYYNEVLNYHP